jgi:mRNA interferase MazF
MVAPTKGAVVLVRFPFSDLSEARLRPVVLLANAERGDWVLCQLRERIVALSQLRAAGQDIYRESEFDRRSSRHTQGRVVQQNQRIGSGSAAWSLIQRVAPAPLVRNKSPSSGCPGPFLYSFRLRLAGGFHSASVP